MKDYFEAFKVIKIDDKTNFWMIRTKRGVFFDEYVRDGFIAIGWNNIKSEHLSEVLNSDRKKVLKEEIQKQYLEKTPGASLNKCIRFFSEVKEGDIAMIVGKNKTVFATIGEYYEENDPSFTVDLEKDLHRKIDNNLLGGENPKCPYIKRRKISAIKEITLNDKINPYLFKAMAVNRHSLSDLHDYAEIILSNCYDMFVYGDKLTITFRVNQEEDINALTMANFVINITKLFDNSNPESIYIKTTLHSPGDIILQIKDWVIDNPMFLPVLYASIFGAEIGEVKLNSIVSLYLKFRNRKHDAQLKAEELRKIKAEADLAEEQVIAQRLDNLITLGHLSDKELYDCSNEISRTAEALNIKPKEIDIEAIDRIFDYYENNKAQ